MSHSEKERIRFGIRFRLVSIMTLLIILPLISATVYLSMVNKQAIEDQTKEYQAALSTQMTEISVQLVQNICSELKILVSILNEDQLTSEQAIRLISYHIASSTLIQSIVVYDEQGNYLDSFANEGKAQRTYIPSVIDEKKRNRLQSEQCYIDQVILHKGRPLLPFIASWKSKDNIIQGYLWTAIDITYLSDMLKKLTKEVYGDQITAYLVDNHYNIVVHPDWKQVQHSINIKSNSMFNGIFTDNFPFTKSVSLVYDKKDWIFTICTIPEMEWMLIVQQERSKAYRQLYTMYRKIALFGSILLLIAAFSGLFIGGRIASPIREVANGARQLSAGKFDYRIAVSSHDEIGQMAGTFNFLGKSLQEYDTRIKQEVATRTDLSRYLSPDLVDIIIARKANLNLGGVKQNITVLFADVVGFTTLTEKKEPELVVSLLNELFTILTQIIFKNGGMIDKFIGDCVMALFGAPNPDPNSPEKAVKTAKEMIRWLQVGNKKWRRQYNLNLELAIAINSGEAIIGNIGSEKRMEYTAMGDVVNTAARMEKIAKPNQILISYSVLSQIPETYNTYAFGKFALRGKQQNIDLYEVVV